MVEVELPSTQDVPVDVYPEGQESTQVALSKSCGEVHVKQLEDDVSQVAHAEEHAVQTYPFA